MVGVGNVDVVVVVPVWAHLHSPAKPPIKQCKSRAVTKKREYWFHGSGRIAFSMIKPKSNRLKATQSTFPARNSHSHTQLGEILIKQNTELKLQIILQTKSDSQIWIKKVEVDTEGPSLLWRWLRVKKSCIYCTKTYKKQIPLLRYILIYLIILGVALCNEVSNLSSHQRERDNYWVIWWLEGQMLSDIY